MIVRELTPITLSLRRNLEKKVKVETGTRNNGSDQLGSPQERRKDNVWKIPENNVKTLYGQPRPSFWK